MNESPMTVLFKWIFIFVAGCLTGLFILYFLDNWMYYMGYSENIE